MADKLHFELVSPERSVASADVDMVTVPGSEGDFGVLANHAPFISTLRAGILTVTDGGSDTNRIFVRGGFADVTPRGLTVLAEEAEPVSEIDRDVLNQKIRNAEEDVSDAKDEAAKSDAEARLAALKEKAEVLDAAL